MGREKQIALLLWGIFRPFVLQIQTTDAFEQVIHVKKRIGNQTTFSCFIFTNRKLLVAYGNLMNHKAQRVLDLPIISKHKDI